MKKYGKTGKVDRRIIKTKKAIRGAFTKLVAQKDIDDITIKELSETANISRKTFYFYYDSVWSLVEDIQNDLVDKLSLLLLKEDFTISEENYEYVYEQFKQLLQNDYKLYATVFNASKNLETQHKLVKSFKERFLIQYSKKFKADDDVSDLALDFVLAGSFYAFKNWYFTKEEHELERFIDVLLTVTRCGLKGLVEKNYVTVNNI